MVLTQRVYGLPGVRSRIETFPYHYGSYATDTTGPANPQIVLGFHTTMVLTQPNRM